uniref:Cadherin domain-containing protein n=1 Tax=Anopheles coluzzii TaxID=1518534 RepID=A0A8W7PGL7_ANOCL
MVVKGVVLVVPNYTLSVIATDTGNPPLHAAKDIFLTVTDINDNAPEFEKDVYHANVMEVADPGTSVIQVTAVDRDEGNNSAIVYSLLDTPDTHSHWFQIDSHSGLITTRAHIDCETDPVPQLIVMAQDNGRPPLSSTGTVLVTIHDVNDNEPIFDQSFYNVSVAENESKGRCILKLICHMRRIHRWESLQTAAVAAAAGCDVKFLLLHMPSRGRIPSLLRSHLATADHHHHPPPPANG